MKCEISSKNGGFHTTALHPFPPRLYRKGRAWQLSEKRDRQASEETLALPARSPASRSLAEGRCFGEGRASPFIDFKGKSINMKEMVYISGRGSSTNSLKMRNSKASENGCLSLFRAAIFVLTQSHRGEGEAESSFSLFLGFDP